MRRLGLVLLAVMVAAALSEVQGQVILFFGRVVDEGGRPIAQAQVAVLQGDLLVLAVETGADGRFQMMLPRGRYVLRIYKFGYQPLYVSFEAAPERGGDIGTFSLRSAITVVADALRISALQGDEVRVRVRVINSGTDFIPVRFELRAPTGWECKLLTPEGLAVSEVSVPPSSQRNLTLQVSIPVNAAATGEVEVTASWAGLSQRVNLTFIVGERRWDVLAIAYESVSGFPGALIRIPLALRNPLQQEQAFSVVASAPPGWISAVVDPRGVTVSRVILQPLTSANLTLMIYVPQPTTVGTYFVDVIVASDLLKISKRVAVSVESSHDIIELALPVRQVELTGASSRSVTVTVRNLGNAPTQVTLSAACQPAALRCYFQASGKGNLSLYVLPSEEKPVSIIIEALPAATPGQYLVRISAVGSASAASAELVAAVSGSKSMRVGTERLAVSLAPGSAGSTQVSVANTGSIPIEVTAYVIEAPQGFLVTLAPSSLQLLPGEEKKLMVTVRVPENATDGVYNVAIGVEGDGIREYRVLVVEVKGGTELGYYAFAAILTALSFVSVLYGQRRGRSGVWSRRS